MAMIRSSFVCNSLKISHMFQWLLRSVFCLDKQRFCRYFVEALAASLAVPAHRVFLFGAGRMALFSLLEALQLQPEDEVIVPGYTCVVVSNAVKYAGLKIRYIDIEPDSLNLDTAAVLAQVTPRTKVIVVSHNFGIVYEDIPVIKEKFPHIIVVEDAAHALGSRFQDGQKAGTKGDAAFFSFEYSKPITTGLGGALVVNNPQLAAGISAHYQAVAPAPTWPTVKIFLTLLALLCTSYRATAWARGWVLGGLKLLGLYAATSQREIQGERPPHYPTKLAPHLALLGYLQLQEIDAINARKANLAGMYHQICGRLPGMRDFYHPDYVYVRYPIIVPATVDENRLEALKLAIRNKTGLLIGDWFNDVVHPRGSYRYGYRDHTCMTGEYVAQHIINFPINIHTTLNEKLLSDIYHIIKNIIDNYKLDTKQ